jgi:hypothetical protein
MRTRTLLAAVAAVVCVSPSIAAAGGPPLVGNPIVTSLFASGDGPDTATYGMINNSANVSVPLPGSTTTSASISYSGGSMSLTATAFSTGGPLVGESEAEGQFFFEVNGAPGAIVPIDFSALGTTFVSGPGGNADADIKVEFGSLAKLVACSNSDPSACTGFSSGFSGAVNFNVTTGHAYSVELFTTCEAASSLAASTTCSASIDPMVTIDPGFIDKDLFTLSFSPDVAGGGGGGGAVPEPATWAILLVGFFGVGATFRRRAPATA